MADLFAVVFDPNNVQEIRTSKTEQGGGGGAKSLNFRGGARSLKGGEILRDLAPGGQIPGGKANPCDTGFKSS